MIEQIVQILLQLNTLLGGNLGITLIVIGVGIRLIFTPLLRKQLDHSQKMRELQPQLNALKKKYTDKTELAQAQTQLFQQAGINPVAGCLPLVIQITVLIILFNAITHIFDRGLNTTFLWLDLAQPDVFHVPNISFPLPGAIILFAGISQLFLSKMMMPQSVPVHEDDDKQEKEEKADLMADLAQAQGQMIYLFPIMFILFGYRYPAGLAIYWAASTVTALAQQWYISGPGGLEEWFKPKTAAIVAQPTSQPKKFKTSKSKKSKQRK